MCKINDIVRFTNVRNVDRYGIVIELSNDDPNLIRVLWDRWEIEFKRIKKPTRTDKQNYGVHRSWIFIDRERQGCTLTIGDIEPRWTTEKMKKLHAKGKS